MKLIGNGKKDYFDYLIHQYGEDPLVVLDRRPIGEFRQDYNNKATGYYTGKTVDKKYGNLKSNVAEFNSTLRSYEATSSWLVLNGKLYPLVREHRYPTTLKLPNEENSMELVKSYWWMQNYEFTKIGVELPLFVELSKELGRHCFILNDLHVLGEVPNIVELGFAKIKSPQEVYLETVDFISKNFAKEMEVSVPQTNNEKIVGHGFDLKMSFRGKK